MELNKLISDLLHSGLTQQGLADALQERNPDLTVTQATISRLLTGKRRNTGFDLGTEIVALHREKFGKRRRVA